MTPAPTTTPLPAEIAGFSLTRPRRVYEVDEPSWGVASLARPHVARALDGATLTVRLGAGEPAATFELKPFLSPAVTPYGESPAVAWRGLLVEQRLLSRPELVWTGAFPKGWEEGLAAPWVEAQADALRALHRRFLGVTEERSADYHLRTLECAECRAARVAKLPTNLPPWQRSLRVDQPARCAHAPAALRALGALCRAHPELTFELLGWTEPAGARPVAEGPAVTRFALTGPLMEALLAPWLVGEDRRLAPSTSYRGYSGSRYYMRSWERRRDPGLPELPRGQQNGVALAASAWDFTGEPEALVAGDASAPPPVLSRAAAPPIESPAALPGERVRGKAARARRARQEK
jgi:hypothetical protein